MVRRIFNAILEAIETPFRKDLPFFLIIWAFSSLPDIAVEMAKGFPLRALYYALFYYAFDFLILFVIDIFKYFRNPLKQILFWILALYTIVNIYCIYTYHTRLTHNFIEIFSNTNLSELREYFSMYITPAHYYVIALYLIVCTVISRIISKCNHSRKNYPRHFPTILLIVSCISIALNKDVRPEMYVWYMNLDDIANPAMFPTNPVLENTDSLSSDFPQAVIILGESFSPSHSSLYGYDKPTNPLLMHRAQNEGLLIFNNIISPASNTSTTFKYLLNTYLPGQEDTLKWYKTTNLIEVLNTAGYSTMWLSNQAKTGLFNNISSSYSALCDTAIFIREFNDDRSFDEQLIALDNAQTSDKKAVFYHLMGQHPVFSERYPEKFNIFTSNDYCQYTPQQADIIACYDNSILYNDYVVDQIIEKYSDKNAIIFYLSDHGLDLFDTDPNYCGHATADERSQKIARHIPFMVYMSPQYLERYPLRAQRIRQNVNTDYCTDKLIYTVMDALGVRFNENDDVNRFSLFSTKQNPDSL